LRRRDGLGIRSKDHRPPKIIRMEAS
jgi:hypothetical protein